MIARRINIVSIWIVLACALAAGIAGCPRAQSPTRELVQEADALLRDQKWSEARVLLKQRLLGHPHDAGAHFLLGRSHLIGLNFRPVIAEGEYETAIACYLAKDRINTIKRFKDDGYFEMMCYIEAAKVQDRIIGTLLVYGGGMEGMREYIDKGMAYVDEARKVRPGAPEVQQYDELFTSYLEKSEEDARGRRPARVSEAI